jgi:hypothetical protein
MKKTINCPCGNGVCKLITEKKKHIPHNKNHILEGDWFIYKCDVCGEGWTTTKSDEESIKNLKQRKL